LAAPISDISKPQPTSELRSIRRDLPDGQAYFIVNPSPRELDYDLTFANEVRSVVVSDPVFPDDSAVAVRQGWGVSGFAAVSPLRLLPGESRIVRTYRGNPPEGLKPVKKLVAAGEVVDITGTWKVDFIEGGPVLPKAYETADLKSWTTRDDPELKRFAGTGKYSITFEKPTVAGATDWTLDLGKVCESARVSLNGKPVATLFANPFRVPVTLKDGKNTLEIEVTNLAANRIADMDRRKVNWKYFHDANLASHPDARQRGVLDASNWPLFDSGLIGPVTLIPEKEFVPAK
jgi:hypothetical protein